MFGETGKNKVLVFFMFLMAAYFIGINFIKQIDKTNANNTYVSMNLVYDSKEDYIEEYIENIKNKDYSSAFYMLDEETKSKFSNDVSKFKEYSEKEYEKISQKSWKYVYNTLSSSETRDMNIYTYKVIDDEDKETVIIDKITIYEYAVNVFKIHLEGVK